MTEERSPEVSAFEPAGSSPPAPPPTPELTPRRRSHDWVLFLLLVAVLVVLIGFGMALVYAVTQG